MHAQCILVSNTSFAPFQSPMHDVECLAVRHSNASHYRIFKWHVVIWLGSKLASSLSSIHQEDHPNLVSSKIKFECFLVGLLLSEL